MKNKEKKKKEEEEKTAAAGLFRITCLSLTIMEMTEKKSLLLWTRAKPKDDT